MKSAQLSFKTSKAISSITHMNDQWHIIIWNDQIEYTVLCSILRQTWTHKL